MTARTVLATVTSDPTKVVVLPAWLFALFVVGGCALVAFLLWANSEARHDADKLRTRKDFEQLFNATSYVDEDSIVHLVPRDPHEMDDDQAEYSIAHLADSSQHLERGER